ncbi:MAG: glycoside hydrolase family 2 TIM barrel-domain containing protein [Clostridia bacterium]
MNNFLITDEPFCDLNTLEINRCAPRANFAPAGARTLLNGKWAFRLLASPLLASDEVVSEAGTRENGYAEIDVPRSWQFAGYGTFLYTDEDFPFPINPPYVPAKNDTGVYKRAFFADFAPDERIFLRFEGVESCLLLYVNEQFVGYSQGSRLPAEFEVTQFVVPGENALTVVVPQYCDGSYLEDQDMWWLGGIIRDVALLRRPARFLRNFTFDADYEADLGRGTLTVRPQIEGGGAAALTVLDENGACVLDQPISSGGSSAFVLNGVTPWNAEAPHLYTLEVRLPGEVVSFKAGFRRVEIRAGVLRLNGQRLMLRGVNRHEYSPVNGRAVTEAETKNDLVRMKSIGLNAVRTAHYPNNPFFYDLCDALGLYVIAECDLETHGFEIEGMPTRLLDDPAWESAYLDRIERTVARDRNHACVTLWSLGNESACGAHFVAMYRWIVENDPTRPVHYEGDRLGVASDVSSTMYSTLDQLRALDLQEPLRPHILCEFAHAMGNGPGGLKEYVELMEHSRRIQGYFVWEWRDHGVYRQGADGSVRYLHGGDFDSPYHSGNFCMDGLLASDGTPTPGFYAYQKAVEPARALSITWPRSLCLQNRRAFKAFSHATMTAQLVRDGEVIAEATTHLSEILPGEAREVKLPDALALPIPENALYTLTLAFYEEGLVLGRAQEILKEYAPAPLAVTARPPLCTRRRDAFCVTGERFSLEISLIDGRVRHYRVDERELMSEGPALDFFRAYIDNDRLQRAQWEKLRLSCLETCVYRAEATQTADALEICLTGARGARSRSFRCEFTLRYRIDGAGRVALWISGAFLGAVNPEDQLPRIGTTAHIDARLENSLYLGFGPDENYVDSVDQAHKSIYRARVDEAFRYECPQDCGNRTGVSFVAFADGDQDGLVFSALVPKDMSAKRCTDADLSRARHAADLPRRDFIEVHFDLINAGLGSGSCGPARLAQYAAPMRPFAFEMAFAPTRKETILRDARRAQGYLMNRFE